MSSSTLLFDWCGSTNELNLVSADSRNIKAFRGDTIAFTRDYSQNLSGYTFALYIKRNGSDITPLKTYTTSNGLSINGTSLTATLPGDLAVGNYYYEIKRTSSGITETTDCGTIRIVTKVCGNSSEMIYNNGNDIEFLVGASSVTLNGVTIPGNSDADYTNASLINKRVRVSRNGAIQYTIDGGGSYYSFTPSLGKITFIPALSTTDTIRIETY